MNRRRDNLFITDPPKEILSPVGRWWCAECHCLATSCKDSKQHSWVVRWEESLPVGSDEPRAEVVR